MEISVWRTLNLTTAHLKGLGMLRGGEMYVPELASRRPTTLRSDRIICSTKTASTSSESSLPPLRMHRIDNSFTVQYHSTIGCQERGRFTRPFLDVCGFSL